jgi:glycosyltransferase involved in cell wall biosynthesis
VLHEVSSLVSIITPTYNHERFIGGCVESVLSQSYGNWEQIIIDDGSTDNTGKIVARYKDPRIRYFSQENQGIGALAANYNRALSFSRGSLVAILEGDDSWPADKLSTMAPIFQDPDVILAFGQAYETNENGVLAERLSRTNQARPHLPRSILFNEPVGSTTPYLLSAPGQTLIPPSTVVIRREALESIGGFQYVPGNSPVDVPTFARLSLTGRFHYFDRFLGYHRYHFNSATVQFLDTMTSAAWNFALASAADPAFGLTATQRKTVEESWQAVPFATEFCRGRICLIKGQTRQARRHFATALGAKDSYVVLASAMGWVFSWLRVDMEWVARLVRRPTLQGVDT